MRGLLQGGSGAKSSHDEVGEMPLQVFHCSSKSSLKACLVTADQMLQEPLHIEISLHLPPPSSSSSLKIRIWLPSKSIKFPPLKNCKEQRSWKWVKWGLWWWQEKGWGGEKRFEGCQDWPRLARKKVPGPLIVLARLRYTYTPRKHSHGAFTRSCIMNIVEYF